MNEDTVGADDTGVWCERRTDDRMHIPWDDIVSVAVTKYDCRTHVEAILEFGHVSGHVLECNDSSSGYDSLITAVGRHYMLAVDWYSAVDELSLDDSLLIWESAN